MQRRGQLRNSNTNRNLVYRYPADGNVNQATDFSGNDRHGTFPNGGAYQQSYIATSDTEYIFYGQSGAKPLHANYGDLLGFLSCTPENTFSLLIAYLPDDGGSVAGEKNSLILCGNFEIFIEYTSYGVHDLKIKIGDSTTTILTGITRETGSSPTHTNKVVFFTWDGNTAKLRFIGNWYYPAVGLNAENTSGIIQYAETGYKGRYGEIRALNYGMGENAAMDYLNAINWQNVATI
jgi:hypothetical protein